MSAHPIISKFYKLFIRNFELFFWVIALVLLGISNPHQEHFTFCAFHHLGILFCPGCGIGHSIGFIFRGEFQSSFNAHPLGLFALVIICSRIFQLIKSLKTNPYKILNHG